MVHGHVTEAGKVEVFQFRENWASIKIKLGGYFLTLRQLRVLKA